MKVCSRCRNIKADTCYHACAKSPDGLQYYCIECERAYARWSYRRVKTLRRAMWGGTLSCKPSPEKRVEAQYRSRAEKPSPNVALLLEQLGVSSGTVQQDCEKS